MFYCDGCAEAKKWPKSVFRSRGNCEVCGNPADCNDTPSKYLPKPVETDPEQDINLNDYVYVKLTDEGHKVVEENWARHKAMFHHSPDTDPSFHEDKNGWSEWQLWVLMETFGPLTYMSGPQHFEDNVVRTVKP